MRPCVTCGVDLPEGARFCFSCGATQAAPVCASCGTQLVPGARFCMSCGLPQEGGTAALGHAGAAQVAQRRVTSVLFGDLVGFTTLAEQRDQEETRELLGRYFEECRQVIGRYGGTVEKFIGDAVMAVWGVPVAHEDDAERSVRAGLELVDAVEAMGIDLEIPELTMRVGIVTGEVAVTMGAEQQGMVAGDAVNTASRVQAAAAPGQVWVDETTRLLTASAITYLDAGSHRLKGKAEPLPLWSVHAVVAAMGGGQRADGLEAPLVGRDRELRLMKELFHSTAEGDRPALLLLVGEAGVGKSRLGWEFYKYVDGLTMSTYWHDGRCVAYGEGLAYFALAEAVRARLRTVASDGGPEPDAEGAEAETLLEHGLERYVVDQEERDWLRARLAVLLGLGVAGTFPREDLFAAWTAFLQHVGGGQHPVVLAIDDAQHADEGLVQFVEHLLAAGTFPCFVLLLTRPGLLERHPGLATNPRATVSHLRSLAAPDMARLVDGLVVGLPTEVRDALVSRSEGVPLYAAETVRSLIDRDLVVPRGGQYVLADSAGLDLDAIGAPASLQALVAARLDALEPDQRRLVERASVLGNSFAREELVELCPDLDVDSLLAGLLRQQVLSQNASRFSAEFGQYQFVQSVVRQVAYSTLSRRDRRALHLAVAGQLEGGHDAGGELAPIIAQHLLDAIAAVPEEPDVVDLEARALAQLERAAARARRLGALRESVRHLQAALDRARDPALVARLEKDIAWALVDAGDYEATAPHALAAVDALDALGQPVEAGLAAAAHGMALTSLGDNANALALAEPRWNALLDVPEADMALLALGKVLVMASSRLGQMRRDVLDRRIQVAERSEDREHLADAMAVLSVDYSLKGAVETGRTLMRAAADMAREHHYPVALARALSNLTADYNCQDLAAALETGREAVEVAGRAGIAVWRDYSEANLLLALLSAGQWEELEHRLGEMQTTSTMGRIMLPAVGGTLATIRGQDFRVPWGEDGAPESDDPSDAAWSAFAQSHEAFAAGRLGEAVGLGERAANTMFELSGLQDDFVHIWPIAIDRARRAGDAEAVQRLLDVVRQASGQVLVPPSVRAHQHRFEGLLMASTDSVAAERLLRRAVDGFAAWGSPHWRARAQADLAEVLQAQGRVEEADELMGDALVTLTDLGAHDWVAQVQGQQVTTARSRLTPEA